jgi:cold shock CspA family protein
MISCGCWRSQDSAQGRSVADEPDRNCRLFTGQTAAGRLEKSQGETLQMGRRRRGRSRAIENLKCGRTAGSDYPDEADGPDMFLHINDFKTAGIDPDRIRIGGRLTFETASTRDGKTKASNVRLA